MTRRWFAGGCCTTPSAMGFWAAAFVLLYGAALLLASGWPALVHTGTRRSWRRSASHA